MMLLYRLGYRFFFWGKRMRKRFLFFEKPFRKYEYFFSVFLNRNLTAWFEKHPVKWGLNTKQRKERYTVSLTSFPTRIPYVHIVIETLMRQSFKPDRIVLWLAESQFPNHQLPETLTALEKRGLTIRYCEDLRSHKKYHYAFQEYPDDNIILADDDLIYPRDTVKKLVKLHKKHPRDIVCVSAQIIAPEMTSPPSVWVPPTPGKRYVSCREAQAFTGAGSLFPPRWYPPEALDKEKAMSMAGSADDLWLKAMSLTAGVKTTVKKHPRGFPVEIKIPKNVTLFQENAASGENHNDIAWQALVNKYSKDWCVK